LAALFAANAVYEIVALAGYIIFANIISACGVALDFATCIQPDTISAVFGGTRFTVCFDRWCIVVW
jgi:hypothetical protein